MPLRTFVPTPELEEYAERFSFCCAVDGCRKRATPPSLRFLGRKVYLATVVTLISAMLRSTLSNTLSACSVTTSRLRSICRSAMTWLF